VGAVLLDPHGVSSSQYVHRAYLPEILSPQSLGNDLYQTVVTSQGLSCIASPGSVLDQPSQHPSVAMPYISITQESLPPYPTNSSLHRQSIGVLNLPPSSGGSRLVVVDDLEVAKFLSENVDLFDSARYLPPKPTS